MLLAVKGPNISVSVSLRGKAGPQMVSVHIIGVYSYCYKRHCVR